MPKVSVIVPIYGVEKYISICIESLINQTYKDFEIIFVNDCTKDKSVQIIQRYATQLNSTKINYKVISHSSNKGLATARNTGVRGAEGKYIFHLDSDDYLAESALETLVQEAERTNADIVVCDHISVNGNSEKYHHHPTHLDKMELINEILFKKIAGSMWGKLIAKSIYDEHPDVWSIDGLNFGEDYVTIPRILFYSSKISYVRKGLYFYTVSNINSYTNNYKLQSMQNMLEADQVLDKFFQGKIEERSIALMRLRTKTSIIKQANSQLYPYLKDMYTKEQDLYKKELPLSDQILLLAVNRGYNKLVSRIIQFLIRKIK